MGRYDALTQMEEKPEKKTPSPVASSPTPKKFPAQSTKKQSEEGKKPENLKSRKPENTHSPGSLVEKPEKYSTLIEANLIKKIKIFAAERDIKDYQVIALALTEYFEKQR
jgi:hypothetical protein